MMQITPIVIDDNVEETIQFFIDGLGGVLAMKVPGANGKGIMHAEVNFHDNEVLNGSVEFADAHDEFKPTKANITIYVPNVQESLDRALKHGAKFAKDDEKIISQSWGEDLVTLKFKNITLTLSTYTGVFTTYMIGSEYEKYCKERENIKTYAPPGFGKVCMMYHSNTDTVKNVYKFYNEILLNGKAKKLMEFPHPTQKDESGMIIFTNEIETCALVICSPNDDYISGAESSLHIIIPDVDAAVARGVTLDPKLNEERAKLQDFFWGERACSIVDPSGAHIFLGTSIPQLKQAIPVIGTTGKVEELCDFFENTFDHCTQIQTLKNKKGELKSAILEYKVGKLSSRFKIVSSKKGAFASWIVYTPTLQKTLDKALKNGATIGKMYGKVQQFPWGDEGVDINFGDFLNLTLANYNGQFDSFILGSKYQRLNESSDSNFKNKELCSFIPKVWSLMNITIGADSKVSNVRETANWYNKNILNSTGVYVNEMGFPPHAGKGKDELAMIILASCDFSFCFMFTFGDPLGDAMSNDGNRPPQCNEFVLRDLANALCDVKLYDHDEGEMFGKLCQDPSGNTVVILTEEQLAEQMKLTGDESPMKKSKVN